MPFLKGGLKKATRAPVLTASTNTPATATAPPKKETVLVMKPSQLVADAPVYVTRRGEVDPNLVQSHPSMNVSKGFIEAGVSQVQGSQGFAIERMGIFTDSLR